jgi:hypothetical protein
MPRRKFSFKLAFRVYYPSATSEFLCVLCVEILILIFALSLLRASVVGVFGYGSAALRNSAAKLLIPLVSGPPDGLRILCGPPF